MRQHTDSARDRRTSLIQAFLFASFGLLLLSGCGADSKPNPSGTLEATEVSIAAGIPGRVLIVGADEGQQVQAGDTLIVLDMEKLRLQREEVRTGLTALNAREKAAHAQLAQAELQAGLADSTLRRIKALHKKGSATTQQLDEAVTQRNVAQRQVDSAHAQLESIAAERDRLNVSLAVIDTQIADGIVIAPSNGTVLTRTAEPGEWLNPGVEALRIADLDRLELHIYLEEQDLDLVRLGLTLPVRIDALANKTLDGTVTWISSEAEFTPKNAQTRDARAQLVYEVKLSVANPDGRLHIGMPAEVVLSSSSDNQD